MAVFDNDSRRLLLGIGIGIGAAAVFPAIASIFKDAGRALAKASIKTGLSAYEKGRVRFSCWSETFEDLLADARTELEAETHDAVRVGPAVLTGTDKGGA